MRLFTPNHQALIQECYPPLVAATPLPFPVSNSLSKLSFYASGRPKKLPKVANVLLERAQKEAKGSGQKARIGLAVTVEVMRGLVTECRTELRCFAEQALKVAELGLGKTPGVREPEIEARAAGLFHSVAVFLSGPLSGLPETLQKQYLRCLAQLSAMARLGPSDAISRLIAIVGLEGGVSSELLYGSATEYESQIQHIVPALLYNCLDQPVTFLFQETSASDTEVGTPTRLGPLLSRKSPAIEASSQSPSAQALASKAIRTLRSVDRLSTAVQLSSKLSAVSRWMDEFQNGALWKNREFVQWIGESTVSASAVQYRAGVVTWWVDQVAEVDDKMKGPVPAAKPATLLYTLTAILQGPTGLVGLGVGSVLGQLTSLVIARAVVGEDDDTFTLLLLRTISALGSRIYYSDQVNDIVSDLVDQIKGLQTGSSGVTSGLDDKGRKRAMKWLVSALRGVLEEAKRGSDEIQAAVPVSSANGNGPSPSVNGIKRGMSELTVKKNGATRNMESSTNLDSLGRPIMQVSAVGRRNPVSPQIFQTSLFLLTEADAAVRHEYERALVSYIEGELVVGATAATEDEPTIDFSNELTRFFVELDASVYELATSQSLGTGDPSAVYLGSLGPQGGKPSKRRHSKSSRRRSLVGLPSVARPFDYAALKRVVQALHLRGSALSILSGVPMLLALDEDAVKWLGTLEEGAERAQACREIVASGLEAIGTAWGLSVLENNSREALSTFNPSVLPYFGFSSSNQSASARFASEARHTPKTVDAGITVDAVSRCAMLQRAAMMDSADISSILTAQWSVAEAMSSAAPPRAVYREGGGSRSVTNLASLRTSHTPERARSIRAPSLVDLQNSIGGQGAGASTTRLGSSANSIASTSATFATTDTRRRTMRIDAANVLANLRGTREQQQEANAVNNRLSVHLS